MSDPYDPYKPPPPPDADRFRINEGDFRPTPSQFACAGCPALDVVCAGPGLPGAQSVVVSASAT